MSCQNQTAGSCSDSQKPRVELPTTQANYKTLFAIPKMDCSAEEQMVKMALQPITQIQQLQFDLINRQLTIWHQQHDISDITLALESLKYGAKWVSTAQTNLPSDTTNLASPTAQRQVLISLLLINASLFILEFGVGIWAKSTGLMGDALDMLADALVYGIALYAVGKAATMQKTASKVAGLTQLLLAMMLLIEIIRRFLQGAQPTSMLMIVMSIFALIGNVICLYLVAKRQHEGVHMKASYIFSANDVLINIGVIVAGVLVWVFNSALPDLLIGTAIVVIVANGARKILMLK